MLQEYAFLVFFTEGGRRLFHILYKAQGLLQQVNVLFFAQTAKKESYKRRKVYDACEENFFLYTHIFLQG